MTQFGRLARAAADDVLDRFFFSLNEDCAWHRAWSGSLMLTAIRDTPESAPVIKGWIEKRAPRVSRAVSAFRPIFDEMLPGGVERCATVLSEIDQFGRTTLPHRAQPGKQYTRSDGDVTLSITDLGVPACRMGVPSLDSRLNDGRSSANRRTQAGAWSFAVQLYGAPRVAVYWWSLGNDSTGLEGRWKGCSARRFPHVGNGITAVKARPEAPISCWRRSSTFGGLRRSCRQRASASRASRSRRDSLNSWSRLQSHSI
jgi:hypothetical protein